MGLQAAILTHYVRAKNDGGGPAAVLRELPGLAHLLTALHLLPHGDAKKDGKQHQLQLGTKGPQPRDVHEMPSPSDTC